MKNLRALLEHEMKDLYSAEKQLLEAMPKMVEAAHDERLRKAFSKHLRETQTQFDTVHSICKMLDVNPANTKCDAMAGLIKECEGMIKHDASPAVKDAGLIACAQRVEHYEISGYGTSRQYAEALGLSEIEQLLEAILQEESDTNEHLNDLAVGDINKKAV